MSSSSREVVRTYGFGRVVDLPYEQALQRMREGLKEQGFGVLTEIDRQRSGWSARMPPSPKWRRRRASACSAPSTRSAQALQSTEADGPRMCAERGSGDT